MRKLIETTEVAGGMEQLLGKNVCILCVNYIYAGKLIGVNDTEVLLENGGIVYETGAFTSTTFKDFQVIGKEVFVKTASIESYAETNKTLPTA